MLAGIAAGALINSGGEMPVQSRAQTYDLSPRLVRLFPRAATLVRSTNLSDRIVVLEQLVKVRASECVREYELALELPRADYVVVARAVFSGGLSRERDPAVTASALTKISFAATKLRIDELGSEFVPFLSYSDSSVQYVALDAIAFLKPNGVSSHVAELLSQPEWPIGRKALETLVALRAREAIVPLAMRLKSTNEIERWGAIKSLDAVGDPAAAPFLAAALHDSNVYNRYWTQQALGRLGAMAELRAGLQSPASVEEEAHILAWLGIAGDKEALTNIVQNLLEGGRVSSATMREMLLKGGHIDSTAMRDTFSATHARQICQPLALWLRQGCSPGGRMLDEGVICDTALFMAEFGSPEAIPFLHELVKKPLPPERRYTTQTSGELARDRIVEGLGKLRARVAVPDLMPLLNEQTAGSSYSVRVAEIALSQIADKASVPALLKRAGDPHHPLRGRILMNLNAAVDETLWRQIQGTNFQGLYVAPINATAASITEQTAIPIVLQYEPADSKSWPFVNTYVNRIGIRFGLELITDALQQTGNDYTFILKNGAIHVVTVDDAIRYIGMTVLGQDIVPER